MPSLLTPARPVISLELAFYTLTIHIANQENMLAPAQGRIELLQDQVHLVASQIRSNEKLEALKKISD